MAQPTAELKEIRLPQGTIRYRDTGSGDPIVFVHGCSSTAPSGAT